MAELLPESYDDEIRYGGAAMADDAQKQKAEELERKKAEVRKRLEEGSKKKQKKGFLTPERKKKLRKLLMMKAAEDLKQQQLNRERERQSALASRIPALPELESVNDHAKLESIYRDMFEKVKKLEEEKFDINAGVAAKDSEINELTIAVNDLRGKFVKPALKKVSKYDNKFKAQAQTKTGTKDDFRSGLKVVKKENVLDDLLSKKAKGDKPEWSNKNKIEKTKNEDKNEDKDEEKPEETAAAEPEAEEEEGEEEEGEEEEE